MQKPPAETVGADAPVEPPPATVDAALDAALRGWVAGVARRDEAAFAELYNATVHRAWSVAMRIVRQREAAEEVVEDCFWQVWREAERFDAARGRVLTWILTICRSRALDYLRRRDIAEPTADIETFRAGDLSRDEDPLDILGATERSSAVHRALAQLKPKERQLISLAFFRGLTHQEIADACRMPLGTVKTTMHKAFRQLQSALGGEGWELPDE
jgi:RNA polymerase sigma-70 factor (ECF subfamily)